MTDISVMMKKNIMQPEFIYFLLKGFCHQVGTFKLVFYPVMGQTEPG